MIMFFDIKQSFEGYVISSPLLDQLLDDDC